MGKSKSGRHQSSFWATLKPLLLLAVGGAILGAGIAYAFQLVNNPQEVAVRPTKTEATFVDNQTCASCHANQYEHWTGSHHQEAMQPATSETMLGNFDDATFTDDAGVTTRFFKQGDSYFVNTEGEDGTYSDFEVAYTFGIDPLQQYLLKFPNGKFQALTVAWDVAQNEWFSLYPGEIIAPNDLLHWTNDSFTANSSCIDCHTTNMQVNYDQESDTYATTWDADNVSCQACHGPGSDHVDWAQNGTKTESNMGLVVDYASFDNTELAESCARCHSRRYPITEDDAYGLTFLDDFMPELLREGLYHADGQIFDEVYVYGSFTQAKMYKQGVGCTDCHNPHTAELALPAEQLCISCHNESPPTERFETLQAKNYDSPEHHHHEAGSEGAQCVTCHMPEQTYMVIDPRHDHSFPIPRPDLTHEWGTPNTCSSCHVEESAETLATTMDEWYGTAWRDRPTIASTFALGRLGAPNVDAALAEIISDETQADIIRATALNLIRQYGTNGLTAMVSTLDDASPLVRATALTGLSTVPETQIVQVVAPSLVDPVRAVRIAAAQALVGVPRANFTDDQWSRFQATLDEYTEAQLALADHPEGHINLGSLYGIQGDWELAEQSYRTAIEKDPFFTPAYQSLATFFYQTGQSQAAEATYREGIQTIADSGSLYYSLGLLLDEQERTDEALDAIATAANLLPDSPIAQYQYGQLLQESGQYPFAEEALLRADSLAPNDRDTLFSLATLYRQLGQSEKALSYAERLNELFPGEDEFINLLTTLQQE